ncbi:NifB/NifX family molybdenum-iron cluster-binding protein [Desulfogranum japonicum]|uniref:NifB/NifX family molybdenum-iron cluster-binding protein n=1 Tax=Desulfogranum japonicum TaxID=231447 RepID=UPI000425BA69|nr:NifB/NifX family molybdenum-iron cluster-binding protein [Desulfogranum japonicum]
MNIALSSTDSSLDSSVYHEFAQTPWLLIVNFENMECLPIAHTCAPESDQELARIIVEHRCEAVITGKLAEKAFDILADDGITRYAGPDMGIREALDAMDKKLLQVIRNPEGSDTCSGDHHH